MLKYALIKTLKKIWEFLQRVSAEKFPNLIKDLFKIFSTAFVCNFCWTFFNPAEIAHWFQWNFLKVALRILLWFFFQKLLKIFLRKLYQDFFLFITSRVLPEVSRVFFSGVLLSSKVSHELFQYFFQGLV